MLNGQLQLAVGNVPDAGWGEASDHVEQYLTELRHYEILLARLQGLATSKARRPAVSQAAVFGSTWWAMALRRAGLGARRRSDSR